MVASATAQITARRAERSLRHAFRITVPPRPGGRRSRVARWRAERFASIVALHKAIQGGRRARSGRGSPSAARFGSAALPLHDWIGGTPTLGGTMAKAKDRTEPVIRIEDAAKTPKEVAAALFEAAAARDLDRAAELQHPDVIDDFVVLGAFHGRDAIRGFFEELYAAFPDFRIEVERIIADDRGAVVQWEASGTFSGAP